MNHNTHKHAALTSLVLGLIFAPHAGQALFQNSLRYPYPQSGRYLGDASYWNSGTNGWTFAYMDVGDTRTVSWQSKGTRSDQTEDIVDNGASDETFWFTEYYWTSAAGGTNHVWGESHLWSSGPGGGWADGEVWE